MADRRDGNPLRTGVFGIFLIASLMLVSAGYTSLPFWPQGKRYEAIFADAGGITPGSDVAVAGIKVGKVGQVSLAPVGAKVSFTVHRRIKIGDQSLAAIKTDTVLGQKSIEVTPAGGGAATVIPLTRTTAPYTLNSALQDLGENAAELDKEQLNEALHTLTDALRDAAPALRSALDGITQLSQAINARDESLGRLLANARAVSQTLNQRAGQVNRLVTDGNDLFAALNERSQALNTLISGIRAVSQQLSGLVTDNEREFGPAIEKLNLVLDNLNSRDEHISEALKALPPYATALGEVVASGPGFQVNVNGVIPPPVIALPLDAYFQPGKLPDSLMDMLRGFLGERTIVRPRAP